MLRSLAVALVLALSLTLSAQSPPDKVLATMKAGEGLQVQLFAAEPMLSNPTNMDIDPLGRVWVTEAVNYRCDLRKKPLNRAEGDRIVILTDKDGDGKADDSSVFYQGKELQAPLGICIIPQLIDKKLAYRVLVSQSPNILEFWDRDGDGKADGPPTVFLTGFRGVDHDHGVHKIQVGPDGKLYFTVGDEGVKDLQSKDGKGKKYTSNDTDCRAGTIWRCDMDGTHLELVAHNFRNPYEVAVDSFGEIWTHDNDDDGNRQCRICFVMPGGNYGYHPRNRGDHHWHQDQPGIVPNVLRTGFGSPTGLCFYEGSLLPEKYRGHLIAADAGPREVTCYQRKPKGAGYALEKTLMLSSSDTWFRPSDVSVAPDGSLFVADWYDPGVGGHGMGDTTRGRIYRIAQTNNNRNTVADTNVNEFDGVLLNRKSPCLSSRVLAHAASSADWMFKEQPLIVTKLIADLVEDKSQDWFLPRGLWLYKQHIGRIEKMEPDPLTVQSIGNSTLIDEHAMTDRLHALAYRIQKQSWLEQPNFKKDNPNLSGSRTFLSEIVPSFNSSIAKSHILKCLQRYDGQDRFYLAALNIACGSDPKRRDEILKDFDKHFPEWNDKVADLVWELRPKCMMPKLDGLLKDAKLTAKQKARIVDILAGSDEPGAGKTVLALVTSEQPAEVKARAIENLKAHIGAKWKGLSETPEMRAAFKQLFLTPSLRSTGLQLVAAVRATDRLPDVLNLAHLTDSEFQYVPGELQEEAIRTLGRLRTAEVVTKLEEIVYEGGVSQMHPRHAEAIRSLGRIHDDNPKDDAGKKALAALELIVQSTRGTAHYPKKALAVEVLAGSSAGSNWLLKAQEEGRLAAELAPLAGRLLRNSPYRNVLAKVEKAFPTPKKLDPEKLPPLADLARRRGDIDAGRKVFQLSQRSEAQCMRCHITKRDGGGAIGPDLSAIGKKASRENLFESILQPSKAIADQFATWKIDTADGLSLTGLIVKESPTEVTLRDANGKDHTLALKEIEKKTKTATSLMADDLAKALTEQELVDLVEYLFSLKE